MEICRILGKKSFNSHRKIAQFPLKKDRQRKFKKYMVFCKQYRGYF